MARANQGRSKAVKALFGALACVGAVWVNWAQIQKLMPALASRAPDVSSAPIDPAMPASATPPDAPVHPAPAVELAPSARAVAVDEELPDPFVHPRGVREEGGTNGGAARAFPEVSLILVGSDSTRACVGGLIVGNGDRVPGGTVRSISDRSVTVALDSGGEAILPLRAKAARSAGNDASEKKTPKTASQPAVPAKK